ncbi:hypothetical protein TCAP_02193 [Tolypocladium capitatum]|uniref:Uncharacterized protein n=1 Tax=Tolypocladium capitatum TaxID=45235 RepID=A0A2K3QK06_9HYPO|nr:hypothetical protein TCAP_02193 [Tolypocladium capitatum]
MALYIWNRTRAVQPQPHGPVLTAYLAAPKATSEWRGRLTTGNSRLHFDYISIWQSLGRGTSTDEGHAPSGSAFGAAKRCHCTRVPKAPQNHGKATHPSTTSPPRAHCSEASFQVPRLCQALHSPSPSSFFSPPVSLPSIRSLTSLFLHLHLRRRHLDRRPGSNSKRPLIRSPWARLRLQCRASRARLRARQGRPFLRVEIFFLLGRSFCRNSGRGGQINNLLVLLCHRTHLLLCLWRGSG